MISVQNVTKRYASVVAVDQLTFEIRRGEVVGLLGPNGAGKSTTMRILTGTLQPDDGLVLFDNHPIDDDLREAKRQIGFLPETNPLYDDMLTIEFLEYIAALRRLSGRSARTAISNAVDETNIESVLFRMVGELSKGFRQRIGLAGAIMHNPSVLILDEPTEGLDPNQRVEIRRLVAGLGRERTVLLSTHVLQEVESTCSRLIVLARGKVVAQGGVDELLSTQFGTVRYIVEVEGADVETALAHMEGVASSSAEHVSGRVRMVLNANVDEELRPRIIALANERGWSIWALQKEKASLEELFQTLTAEASDNNTEQLIR